MQQSWLMQVGAALNGWQETLPNAVLTAVIAFPSVPQKHICNWELGTQLLLVEQQERDLPL